MTIHCGKKPHRCRICKKNHSFIRVIYKNICEFTSDGSKLFKLIVCDELFIKSFKL